MLFASQGLMKWLYYRIGLVTSLFAILTIISSMIFSPYNSATAVYTGLLVSYGLCISF